MCINQKLKFSPTSPAAIFSSFPLSTNCHCERITSEQTRRNLNRTRQTQVKITTSPTPLNSNSLLVMTVEGINVYEQSLGVLLSLLSNFFQGFPGISREIFIFGVVVFLHIFVIVFDHQPIIFSRTGWKVFSFDQSKGAF